MEVMLTATRPGVDGMGVAWASVAVVAGWTLAALAVLAVRARRTAAD
jgi:hypothetical protein